MLRVWYERLSRLVKFEGLTRNAVPEVKSSHYSMTDEFDVKLGRYEETFNACTGET